MTAIAVSRIMDALRRAGVLVGERGQIPVSITGLADDSRQVVAGGAFIAVPGAHDDGHSYVRAAAAAGAVLAIAERDIDAAIPVVTVSDARRAAAAAAAAAYDNPARTLRLIGVTGTDGKTTTVSLARGVLDRSVARAASLGTLGILVGADGRIVPGGAGLTTPGPVELQRVLRTLADANVKCVVAEVSSHSLAQRRVAGLSFAVVAFTTFTRDHLDFHGTMDAYFEAKARLLEQLAPTGSMVVNADDPAWQKLPRPERTIAYGRGRGAFVRATNISLSARGSAWTLAIGAETAAVELPLIGDVNVGNALAAAAIAHALGGETEQIAGALSAAPQIAGRLEVLAEAPLVLRDYAHTPDALERALAEVRRLGDRVIVVFGCGGDRDRGKRPLMGGVAAAGADRVIVTSDNPRTEDPSRIIDDIVAGMSGSDFERIEDRRDAIERALAVASSGDVVLVAGKGHETYQIRGTTAYPFDEKEIVADLLAVRR